MPPTPGGPAGTYYVVYSPLTDTANSLAAKIATDIVASGLNMTATQNGSTVRLTNLTAFANNGSPITDNNGTLNVVSAIQLVKAGDQFTLTGNSLLPVTFVFGPAGTVLTGRQQLVAFTAGDDAAVVAQDIFTAINAADAAFGLNITPTVVNGNQVSLAGPLVLFDPGNPATTYIQLTGTQTNTAGMLKTDAAAGQFTTMQVDGSLLHVIGHTITDAVSNVKGVDAYGNPATATLPYADILNGDLPTNEYDRYQDTPNPVPEARTRGQNNAAQGWYVDDVQIGLAGRGQMVDSSTANTTFSFKNPGGTVAGYYQLQIRRASNYATWPLPTTPPTMGLLTSYDINDRLSNSLTLTVPSADELSHGATFTLSDGVKSVTFQYLGKNVYDGSNNPNDQPIYFNLNDTPAAIATETAAAINLANTRGLFTVEATPNGNSDQVYLFQAVNINYGTSWAEGQPQPTPAGRTNPLENVTADNLSPATYYGTTIAVPAGKYIVNGQTFTISDGVNTVVIHLHNNAMQAIANSSASSSPNLTEVSVNYNATDTATTVALAIMQEINLLNNTINPATGLPEIQVAAVISTPPDHITLTLSPGPLPDDTITFSQEITVSGIAVDSQAVQYINQGDATNLVDQGQDMIEEDTILNSAQWGIDVTGAQPTAGNAANLPAPVGNDPTAHPYSAAVMRAINTDRLVPGVTIENNVVAYGGTGGILFSGDPTANGQTQAAVPFGRIVNNTVYGGAAPSASRPRRRSSTP